MQSAETNEEEIYPLCHNEFWIEMPLLSILKYEDMSIISIYALEGIYSIICNFMGLDSVHFPRGSKSAVTKTGAGWLRKRFSTTGS